MEVLVALGLLSIVVPLFTQAAVSAGHWGQKMAIQQAVTESMTDIQARTQLVASADDLRTTLPTSADDSVAQALLDTSSRLQTLQTADSTQPLLPFKSPWEGDNAVTRYTLVTCPTSGQDPCTAPVREVNLLVTAPDPGSTCDLAAAIPGVFKDDQTATLNDTWCTVNTLLVAVP